MNMGLLAADLSLGSSSSCAKEITSGRGRGVAAVGEKQHLLYPLSSYDLHALQVYHKALEDERLKIQAFERELPFCMQLLENAIEASRDQLEERLACKLNTPLHEPQLAAATQEFVCNYTSSVSHKSSLPAIGEINLRFKRRWTSTPSSSTHDRPRPYNHTASACTTKWLLPQNNKLAQNEDSPITIKGSIKLQEFTRPEHALQVATEEPQKTSSQIVCNTKSIALNHTNATPTHATRLHNSKQALYSSVIHQQIQADKYMVTKMQDVPVYDVEGQLYASAMPVRSINDAASLDATQSPSTYPRPLSLTNLSPKELQISTATSEAGFHANNTALQSGGVQRKPRRCWSPELHQRFLSALNHLGGCQVATPKQIRELMNVEGLTNDEVKSHLQKFRLHMRRPNGALANSHSDSQQAAAAGHHLVVFGHIWVPPEYEDQHHQHATNANMDIISTEFPSANGGMQLMKSFKTSCSNKLNSMDHAGPVQHDSDLASARLMRLCQEEYCSDEDQLMYESKGLHEIQLLDEGKKLTLERNAPSPPTDVESECCRQQQSAGDDVHHHRIFSRIAMKERLLSRVDCINHDQFAAAEVSKKGECHGKLHLNAGDTAGARMNEKAEETLAPQIVPECEVVARKKMKVSSTSTDQQLLQLHAEDKNENMDDSEDHYCDDE